MGFCPPGIACRVVDTWLRVNEAQAQLNTADQRHEDALHDLWEWVARGTERHSRIVRLSNTTYALTVDGTDRRITVTQVVE